jgi:hypothetical protein
LLPWFTQSVPLLNHVPIVIAMIVTLAFLAEMLRKDGRPSLINSLAATVTGAIIATGMAGWIATAMSPVGAAMVVVGALALVFASFVVALSIKPGWLAAVITIWIASGVGMAAGHFIPYIEWDLGLIIGFAAGVSTSGLRALLANDNRYQDVTVGLAVSTVPIAVSGILMYSMKWLFLAG